MILDVPQFERPLSLTEKGRDELRRGRIISLARAREIAMDILDAADRREHAEQQMAKWLQSIDEKYDRQSNSVVQQPVYRFYSSTMAD